MCKPFMKMVLSSAILLAGAFSASAAYALTSTQKTFLDAEKALKKQDYDTYKPLRAKLGNYPLAIYLDHDIDIGKLNDLRGEQAKLMIDKYKTTPMYQRLRAKYLLNAGAQKRWNDFLTIAQDVPTDVRLQCYFYEAKLAKGEIQTAYTAAQSLWVYGGSRPKECDPLFNSWTKAGKRTQDVIWARMLLSFDAGESSLLSYLSQKMTSHSNDAKRLVAVYKDPNSLRHTEKFRDKNPIVGDIVLAGLKSLSRKDLDQAINLYTQYHKNKRFTPAQDEILQTFLVRRVLIEQNDDYKAFADQRLPMMKSDEMIERRLRWAIREQDTEQLARYLPLLSQESQAKERWQFWQARVSAKQAQEKSTQLLATISNERDFYGFAASQLLNKPISLNQSPEPVVNSASPKLEDDLGFVRVKELMALDRYFDARYEWVALLKRSNNDMRARYGRFAHDQGWYDFGVEASIQGKLWDDIPLRFPLAHTKGFEHASKKHNVNVNEIIAISRRESAFFRYATSGVGARGLMQIMPTTAKATAKKYGATYRDPKDLYDAELNLNLGSAYYSQLLKDFNQNRILATAAYNAGPSRVRRWLSQSEGKLDAISFIESIPFTETREYVQAVLSYRLIYEAQKQKPQPLFNEAELSFKY
ncbi:transglycosylase SLT domain-containing protein [Shewanella acanthi]|uniref:transglycosylase SLT domain-containing protein n=1 Tax=Shewanella acanthi TaxID=2864212 RepID=UPI001C654C2A|nr:transglycosylase SLT domain-containing protein [Shewanella acanthi]QYJ80364.1 transglycosylase SLT domain-containing protein [Shewanella acanthi]